MITVEQAPFNFSGFRQRFTIITATSTNITEDGFRYKVIVTAAGRTLFTGYVPPNPNGALVFDLYPILNRLGTSYLASQNASIHTVSNTSSVGFNEKYPTTTDPANNDTLDDEPVVVNLDEAWLVGGVLTDNPDIHSGALITRLFYNRTRQASAGYRPNPNNDDLTGLGPFMTDRTPDTKRWQLASTYSIEDAGAIYIPTFSTDSGIVSIIYAGASTKSALNIASYTATQVQITIFDSIGSPTSYAQSITSLQDGVIHLPLYPANIQASSLAGLSALKPNNNPNWRFYRIRLLTSGGSAASSQIILYNAELSNENDCRYDRVRLGWVNGDGGYDYSNFIKKSESSVEVERKEYETPLGNYGDVSDSVDFTFSQESRGITHTRPLVKQFITVNSDWMTAGEFALLKNLIVSSDVHKVNIGSTGHVPVTIQDTTYIARDDRDGKLYNLTLKLRVAHNLWA